MLDFTPVLGRCSFAVIVLHTVDFCNYGSFGMFIVG